MYNSIAVALQRGYGGRCDQPCSRFHAPDRVHGSWPRWLVGAPTQRRKFAAVVCGSAKPMLALVGLSAARVATRSVLVAGIYPDRPWEKALGTDIQELERLRKEVLRVRAELQQSQNELESQQTPPRPSQGRVLGKRAPERDLSNLLSLGLWVSLGAFAGQRMHAGGSIPAPQLVDKAAAGVTGVAPSRA